MKGVSEETRSAPASKWRRYPEHRNSGIEWLCDIPAHWDVHKLGSRCSVKARLGWKGLKAAEYVDDGYIFLATPNIKPRDIDFENVDHITAARYFESPEIILRVGDVLMAKDGATLGIINLVSRLPAPATVNGSIAVLRPKPGLDSSFLYYWLSADYSQQVIQRMKGGMGVPHLFQADLRKFVVACPDISEQKAIAAFLDRETAKIDALISKRQQLIALLEEKRAALISHAVTEGLDPTVPMRNSGIDWLGEIPAHWLTPPLYARYEVQLGKMLDSKRITGTRLAPYLRNVDVQWDYVNTEDLPNMDFSESDRERFALRRGDLLVCEGGEVGRTALWNGGLEECYYQKAIHRLRPRYGEDSPRYLFYVMYAASKFGVFRATGNPNTIDHLTAEKLRAHRFPLPPPREQHDIVEHLDRRISATRRLETKCHESIKMLREYHTALISAAVTGKIDVRGEVQ